MDIAADGASSPAPLSATQFPSVGALPQRRHPTADPGGRTGCDGQCFRWTGPQRVRTASRCSTRLTCSKQRADAKSTDKKIKQSGEWRVTVLRDVHGWPV